MCAFRFEVWPTEYRQINQYFGANPQNYAQFGLPGHEGLDIMAPTASKVFVVAPGQVRFVHTNPNNHNYGIHVRVAHEEGYQTIYAHLKEAWVQPGQNVVAGAVMGLANDTGNSFGSHLHLTLKKEGADQGYPSNIIDPTPYLLPLMGWNEPAGPYEEGWAYLPGLTAISHLAQVNHGGINLRRRASVHSEKIGFVSGGTILMVNGEKNGKYLPVKAAAASITYETPPPADPPIPDPPPPATVTTVDGWGFAAYLMVVGDQAVIGEYGINLRTQPNRNASNIGLVRGNSTVDVTGPQVGEYLPVRVRRGDFQEPVNLPPPPPPQDDPPIGRPAPPAADTVIGWAWTPYLIVNGQQTMIGRFGINMRSAPNRNGANMGLLKGSAAVTIVGEIAGEYTPVLARKEDVLNLVIPVPEITPYTPITDDGDVQEPEIPIHDTTPGWAFTNQITVSGDRAFAGPYGINLREQSQRDAAKIGFVPAGAEMIVTGLPQGEYTPVRVDDAILDGTADPAIDNPPQNPDPPILGKARIGLHASADPVISEAEHQEFKDMRPGMIKVLSFHSPEDIQRLAQDNPDASWVVRAFLDFGGRQISPEQFVRDTRSDVERSLRVLRGKDVMVELHNEPNLVPEGLGASWENGAAFASWWLDVLHRYRQQLPGVRFLYPGLSPGHAVTNLKHDHIQFIEASRTAVEAADGLAVHIYWSNVYPMSRALDVLDDYIGRFRFKEIWITEASNNKGGVSSYRKGQEYLEFWHQLQQRSTVQGVTYFVASASNPAFNDEVWVGRGIGRIIGRR